MGFIKIIVFIAIVFFAWQYLKSPSGQNVINTTVAKIQEINPLRH